MRPPANREPFPEAGRSCGIGSPLTSPALRRSEARIDGAVRAGHQRQRIPAPKLAASKPSPAW